MYFTVPVTLILFILHFPVLTSRDKIKLIYLNIIFTFYVALWFNYVAYHKMFIDDPQHILLTIGCAPFEQYLLLFFQSLITTLLHLHIMKFTLPILHIGRFGKSLFQIFSINYVIPSICLCVACWAWQIAIPNTNTFYLVSKTNNEYFRIILAILPA